MYFTFNHMLEISKVATVILVIKYMFIILVVNKIQIITVNWDTNNWNYFMGEAMCDRFKKLF